MPTLGNSFERALLRPSRLSLLCASFPSRGSGEPSSAKKLFQVYCFGLVVPVTTTALVEPLTVWQHPLNICVEAFCLGIAVSRSRLGSPQCRAHIRTKPILRHADFRTSGPYPPIGSSWYFLMLVFKLRC